MNDKLQTQVTYFLLNRNVLGVIWVLKRMVIACTAGSAFDRNWLMVIVFLGIREGLSAITDYSQPRNPVNTTQQSSPPNPAPETPTDHV